ncbi:MAG: nucleoside deaminase [Prevotellaceae bacterium]|jgi:tRNA(Arg) A34 adenosine deaminase TadA|nr:nucleoside deaminase [Prevotellaceae bacterium]
MGKAYTFLREAIRLAEENISQQGGGPFGAVIVKNGEIIATATNTVTTGNDPTAHAEVNAIRAACRKLDTFDLNDCEIYASCEPCPMCLAAIYWARIGKVYFAGNRLDAQAAGFDDSFIYEELEKPLNKRKIPAIHALHEEGRQPLQHWIAAENKTKY